MIRTQKKAKKSSPKEIKKVVPAIILLSWICPKCECDNDLENGVINSHIFHKKLGQDLVCECEWCKEKVVIDYDEVIW